MVSKVFLRVLTGSFLNFVQDESGTTTVDVIVFTAAAAIYGAGFAYDTAIAVNELGDDVSLCLKRQKNTLARDDWDYQKKLQKMAVKCGRV